MIHRFFLCFTLCFPIFFGVLAIPLTGQTTITGKIIDQLTQEPLAFANIVYDIEQKKGVTADIQGNFTLISAQPVSLLRVSYLGYEAWTGAPVYDRPMTIVLTPAPLELEEVVIYGDKNPTRKLIQKVIDNRKNNDPLRLPAFSYSSYNKITYDLFVSGERTDTTLNRIEQMAGKNGLLIMESSTRRKFLFPDKDEEVITGTKVSGFKNPLFASLATDIQPFSFYNEIIPILDRSFVNPIASGSLSRYDYHVTDTLYGQDDTVYVVAFTPQKGKKFDALTGSLYINTYKYAVQNVIARPADPGLIDVVIEQLYSRVEEEFWFPEQLNFELIIRNYPQKDVGMKAGGKSFIRDVSLNTDLEKKDFGLENVKMEKNAGKRDSAFWENARVDSLTPREVRTYAFADSLGEKAHFDEIMNQAEKLSRGRLGWKFLEIDINKLYVFNEYEGNRPGLGLYTGNGLSSRFSVGGYFGYGFRDKEWKYGGNLTLNILPQRDLSLYAAISHDVLEPGQSGLDGEYGLTSLRSFLASRMDIADRKTVELRFRGFRYSQFTLGGTTANRTPGYEYTFIRDSGPEWKDNFAVSELYLRFRYAYQEQVVESFGQKVSLGSNYPVFSAFFIKGLTPAAGGQLSYYKAEAEVSHTFKTKSLGDTRILIRGGMAEGGDGVPAPFLFFGPGAKNTNPSVYLEDYFQTMGLYEFLSDRYVNVFIRQDLGSLLFQTPKFKPRILLVQGAGWGTLRNPSQHQGFDFKTMEKGFFESGIMVNQLLRINYLNIAYLGLGGGVFYRYGQNRLPEFQQNLAAKVSLTFSTR
ncbi:MAG: DUF5686 family protein [Bacteroidia bacterium]